MEQPHSCLTKAFGGRQLEHFLEIAVQHAGFPNVRNPSAVRLADGLLDQADLDAGAHIAEDDFDQILGFERSGPSQ